MKKKEQFFGIVRSGKFKIFAPQHLEGNIVRLTAKQKVDSELPESEEINLSEYEDKIIEVSGLDSGDWISSAVVVEEAGPVLSDFLRKVFCKDQERKKHCVLIIGHKKDSPGAVNKKSGTSEFEFNEKLVSIIEKKVKNTKTQRVHRRTYETLPADLNVINPDFVVSMHCNYSDGRDSGTAVLYYHKSEKGRELAEILLKHLVDFLKLPNRGIKPKTVEDKGGYLLCYTKAPCIIAESFFIDNDEDLSRAMENFDGLAETYARALDEISKMLIAADEEFSIAI